MAGKKESEHYLDQLLYSVNGTGDEKTMEEFFLKELEYELESDEYKEFLSDFEMELEEEEKGMMTEKPLPIPENAAEMAPFPEPAPDDEEILKEPELLPDEGEEKPMPMPIPVEAPEEPEAQPERAGDSTDAILDKVAGIVTDIVSDGQGGKPQEQTASEPTGQPQEQTASELAGQPQEQTASELAGQPQEQAAAEPAGQPEEELSLSDLGEPDLLGNGAEDLLQLLAGEKGLEDLGDLLSEKTPVEPEDGLDEIQEFAENEMQEQERAVSGEADKTAGKKVKFMDKLKHLLFGDDEEEPAASKTTVSQHKSTASELSEENEQILKELEEAEEAGKGKKDKKGRKEKQKKEKKEKPKKEKKAKKEKKKKEPKPKKPKPPKEKDNTPPLPKGPVFLILLLVGSLTALVLLGTSFAGYSSGLAEARTEFNNRRYVEAYQLLKGYKIKEADEKFFGQTAILAAVSSEYESYQVFANYGEASMALDSLICAAGRYQLNLEKAQQYECTAELDILRGEIEEALAQSYGISLEEAFAIYDQRNRTEYTVILHNKLKELGLE